MGWTVFPTRRLRKILFMSALLTEVGCSSAQDVADARVPTDIQLVSGEYTVGTHALGEVEPEHFVALQDGASLTASTTAGQGWWMVVVSARTNRFSEPVQRVDVDASLKRPEGATFAQNRYQHRPFVYDGAGYGHATNLFIALPFPDDLWLGQEATLELSIRPSTGGATITGSVSVVINRATERTPNG